MSLGLYLSIILPVTGLLIGAIYKIIEGKSKSIKIAAKIVMHLCVLAIAFLSFIFFLPNLCEHFYGACPASDSDPEHELKIEITSLTDGDILSHENMISGTIEGQPDSGTYIWLVVNPASNPGTYWPQNKPIDWFDGKWNASVVLGEENSSGEKYFIYVISVNAADNLVLIENINKGKEKSDFEGITLPSSAEKLAKVAVVRD